MFNGKKIERLESDLTKTLIELHDLKELKENLINFFNAEKANLESDIIKEKRKKRPCPDRLFILSEVKAKIGEAQNRTIESVWGE